MLPMLQEMCWLVYLPNNNRRDLLSFCDIFLSKNNIYLSFNCLIMLAYVLFFYLEKHRNNLLITTIDSGYFYIRIQHAYLSYRAIAWLFVWMQKIGLNHKYLNYEVVIHNTNSSTADNSQNENVKQLRNDPYTTYSYGEITLKSSQFSLNLKR